MKRLATVLWPSFNCLIMQNKDLRSEAQSALAESYSPYSQFRVGAGVLCTREGKIFTGTNIENASFSLSICAERVALFKAISEGYRSFTDLAIVSSSSKLAFSLVQFRQVLAEFNMDIIIHLGDHYMKQLSDLLPDTFGMNQLHT